MINIEAIHSILEEINISLQNEYLSEIQVQIMMDRLENATTYKKLKSDYNLSGNEALTHCLLRTCKLEKWYPSMKGGSDCYLSSIDQDYFEEKIKSASEDQNCIPAIYALSLAYYLKKRRNSRAYMLLTYLNNNELAQKCLETEPPSKTWIYGFVRKRNINIVSSQQIELLRRSSCDDQIIGFYFLLHSELFKRHRSLIINMDETMLSAKRRFKVLVKKGLLPLIPEAMKLPHFTGCVCFSASGKVFKPLIILPNKKTFRTFDEFKDFAYFGSTMAGWMTLNTFTYFTILLVCQLSHYRLTLPDDLKDESILLLVDGHPSRFNFTAALILYLFNIDLVLIPPHTSHILQAFDVGLASPLKTYFKEYLAAESFDDYIAYRSFEFKQTARELRRSMIRSFINALHKCTTINNIENAFKKTGICPLDVQQPLNSQYTIRRTNWSSDNLLREYWLNSPEGLKELFMKENKREITAEDYNINIHQIFHDLKLSSIEDGKALSDLPPLFEESESSIEKIIL